MTSDGGMVPIVTCVLWSLCLSVGAAGMWIGYPVAAPRDVSPLRTRVVEVQTSALPSPPPPPFAVRVESPKIGGVRTLSAEVPLPPVMERMSLPAAPPLAVASPNAAVAFAVPVERLAHVVEASNAAYHGIADTRNATGTTGSTAGATGISGPPPGAVPAVTHLTFGEGEGNQPAPEYPRAAQLAGQEGAVGLRFTVDAQGKVTSVETVSPSRWPLLNAAASRTVRAKWRFGGGAERTYDVTMEFQLQP